MLNQPDLLWLQPNQANPLQRLTCAIPLLIIRGWAGVVEWQTRMAQNHLRATAWGFESLLRHLRVIGSLGHWVVGSLGRWVVGSLGRWVIGPNDPTTQMESGRFRDGVSRFVSLHLCERMEAFSSLCARRLWLWLGPVCGGRPSARGAFCRSASRIARAP